MNTPQLLAVKIGRVQTLPLPDGSTLQTAIRKTAVNEVAVDEMGAAGNEVGDTRHHGGADKALFLMAQSSLDALNRALDLRYDYTQTTVFGENIVVSACDEDSVCVGDVYRIGGALVEVSQPRKPCNRLSQNSNMPEMRRVAVETGWVGWYVRVLEGGIIRKGDAMVLQQRPSPDLTISRLHRCLSAPAKTLDEAFVETALQCPALAEAYKVSLRQQQARCLEQSDQSAFFNTPWF